MVRNPSRFALDVHFVRAAGGRERAERGGEGRPIRTVAGSEQQTAALLDKVFQSGRGRTWKLKSTTIAYPFTDDAEERASTVNAGSSPAASA